jgi:hypothetical protein
VAGLLLPPPFVGGGGLRRPAIRACWFQWFQAGTGPPLLLELLIYLLGNRRPATEGRPFLCGHFQFPGASLHGDFCGAI